MHPESPRMLNFLRRGGFNGSFGNIEHLVSFDLLDEYSCLIGKKHPPEVPQLVHKN